MVKWGSHQPSRQNWSWFKVKLVLNKKGKFPQEQYFIKLFWPKIDSRNHTTSKKAALKKEFVIYHLTTFINQTCYYKILFFVHWLKFQINWILYRCLCWNMCSIDNKSKHCKFDMNISSFLGLQDFKCFQIFQIFNRSVRCVQKFNLNQMVFNRIWKKTSVDKVDSIFINPLLTRQRWKNRKSSFKRFLSAWWK